MKMRKREPLNELKKLLKKRNYSYRKFAEEIHMSVDALNNKLNGYTLFNTWEVDKLVVKLQIEPDEINRYFFPEFCEEYITMCANGEEKDELCLLNKFLKPVKNQDKIAN